MMNISDFLKNLAPRAMEWGVTLLLAISILILGWIVAGWTSRLVNQLLKRSDKVDPTIRTFTASFVRYSILIITLMAVLAKVGVQTASLVALLGAAGLAIGLALQGTLSDVAAGVILLVVRPFRVGDAVILAGLEGVVRSVTLFTTEIATADNRKVVIPNSKVWGQPIQNLTAYGTRKLEIPLQIDQSRHVGPAVTAVMKLLADHPQVLKFPEPAVQVESLADGTQLMVRAWTDAAHLGDAKADLLAKINQTFAEEDISLVRRNAVRTATV
jgi:small conductance mechanosensitive channel